MNTLLFYWLDKIQPSERSLVGDKAFYLSQQAQAGRAVIPGFAIATSALRTFLATYQWSEPILTEILTSTLHVNVNNVDQLQRLAQLIRAEILAAELPETWSDRLKTAVDRLDSTVLIFRPCLVQTVKSTPSEDPSEETTRCPQISGVLDSRVCTNHRDILAQALKETWAELFTARSLFYWQRSGMILSELNLAILVQPVWDAIAAGSVETQAARWLVKATWGLGMSMASGKTIPDIYQINPNTGKIEQQTLGRKLISYQIKSNQRTSNQLKKTDGFEPAIASNPSTDGLDASSLKPEISVATNLQGCTSIESLVLSEQQQQQYVLSPGAIAMLTDLTKTLIAELGDRIILDWVVCRSLTSNHLENSDAISLESEHSFRENLTSMDIYLTNIALLECDRGKKDLDNSSFAQANHLQNNHNDDRNDDPLLVGVGAAPGEAIGSAFVIPHSHILSQPIPPGSIIVTKMINVETLFCLQEAAGVIVEQGSITSHAAILARELGIPAVVSATGATEQIQQEDRLLVNGDRGTIYKISEAMSDLDLFSDRQKTIPNQSMTDLSKLDKKPINLEELSWIVPPTSTQLFINVSQARYLEKNCSFPVDGVGLLRAELMILDSLNRQHPQEWIQSRRQDELVGLISDRVMQIARYMFPRPVFYRSCDLPFFGQTPPTNPALGMHGTFSYLLDSSLFELELAALDRVQTEGYSNINLILPFIRSVEEFTFCRQRVEQIGLNRIDRFQLWIMAEVPSVIFLLEDYIKAGVQGIAIGTNDLTQLLFGADRNHPEFANSFDARHPAVRTAISQLVLMAKQGGISCSVCGQAVSVYPDLLDDLIRWGVTAISVEPIAVENTYRAIVRSEKRLIIEAARRQLDSQ